MTKGDAYVISDARVIFVKEDAGVRTYDFKPLA